MKGAQWMDIRSDRQKGLSYVELCRKYRSPNGKAVRGIAAEAGVHIKLVVSRYS